MVDCFASEENGRISFNWSKLADIQDKLPSMDAKDMLAVPRVQEAFREDKKWIDWCNICILTLPSGKSSHLEAGYAKGQGKMVIIFGELQKGDFDVMYGFADAIFRCDEIDNMVDFVNRSRPHTPAPENTCEENGCSDIENCDEICQHSRIFSPVQMREARKQEREQVLDALDGWFKEHDCRKSERGNYWIPVPFPASELMRFVESLRGKP